jgi:hypothetical protein
MDWLGGRFDVLARACTLAPEDGLILEFGVASGSTIGFLAAHLWSRKVYGFDSFCGLPEPWAAYPSGYFACQPPAVPDNVELIQGMFADTLAPFLAKHPGNAALIHVDCDLYSSTRTVLEALAPRIVPGTVIVLDEYWIVPEHEFMAFQEFLRTSKRRYRYDCRATEQACVVME